MVKTNFFKNSTYEAPVVLVVEVAIERGFAESLEFGQEEEF